MDIIAGFLIVYGLMYAADRAARAARTGVSGARVKAAAGHSASPKAIQARAARQATVSFWAGELLHPSRSVTWHGFREGWAEHQHAMAERDRDRAKRQADHAEQRRTWADEIAGHRQRIDQATQRGQQDDAEPGKQDGDPPLPDGRTPGNGPPASHDNQPAPDKPAPETTKDNTTTRQPGSSTVGDFSYEDTVKTCDDLIAAADSAVNEQDLQKATSLADGLGAMVPEDSTTLGQAADVAQAIRDVQESNQRLQDTTGALKDRVVKTYGSTQESVDASGERAPQPEFLDH